MSELVEYTCAYCGASFCGSRERLTEIVRALLHHLGEHAIDGIFRPEQHGRA